MDSPLGHLWFNGGGGGIGLSSVRLLLCEEVSKYCGGVIRGSGNDMFCGRLKQDCGVQSHKTQKVLLRENHLYIRAPRGDQVMAENGLDAGPLSEETITQMLGVSKPIDLWVTYFLSLTTVRFREERLGDARDMSTTSSTGSEWEDVGRPASLEDFDRARTTLRTPKRMKVGTLLAALVDTSPSDGVELDPLEELTDLPEGASTDEKEAYTRDALLVMIEEWPSIKNNFERLSEELKSNGASESKFREVLAATVSSLQAVVHDSDSKIQLLASRIGENRIASDGGSLTCWDAIKQLQGEMESVEATLPLTDQAIQENKQACSSTDGRLKNLGQSFDNMAKHYRTTISNINEQLGRLSRRGPAPGSIHGAGGIQFGTAPTSVGTDLIALRQRVKELEDNQRQGNRAPNRHEDAAINGLVLEIRELERKIDGPTGGTSHLERSMAVLKEKVKEMEGRVTDSSFRLNQYTFSTFYEVKTWCEETEVVTFGIFWDLFSVLVAMKPKYQTGKDIADERYSSARIKSTPFENDLAAAMSHPRPLALFGKRGGELAGINEGFGACPTYEQWVGSGCDSIKVMLTTQLNNYCAGVNGTLDFNHPGTPFVSALLNEVQSHSGTTW